MNIKITSDHGGHDAKVELAKRLTNEGYKVQLYGSKDANTSISYADVAIDFAKELKKDPESNKTKYVAFCGSGIGISIALNRFKDIRCARVTNEEEAKLAKSHNNANILCMGGRLLDNDTIENIFHAWEKEAFEGGRHVVRINKLKETGQE
ncbi:RpiB/LacA/LacB family sugar-phosphate isomerase [Metamycoplasma phocicerebrale]|uniref:RpiB/LacA/LacB family sugar-phosphate isomerase n=1 Tax=Metamycoplasma phocicerebrale TaxID=142649 RepID=A0A3T0TUE0_9BACT|nr:RpiB/LacA/LacB family sugar-phosphate isomerase [Metamycoplasma phocicerebrale]AZZ65668.1 RpiB/LacA/LacB family sugar-phosphate isomerase [Metamycoplasma phocicerebrale]